MKELKINHLAVLVIVVLSQVIPATWYGIFAEQWMALNKLDLATIEANQSSTPYIASMIASLISTYALALLFQRMKVESAVDGLAVGALIGFAFTHLPHMVQNLFSFRPYALSWVDGGVNIIVLAVAGLILGAWRKYK